MRGRADARGAVDLGRGVAARGGPRLTGVKAHAHSGPDRSLADAEVGPMGEAQCGLHFDGGRGRSGGVVEDDEEGVAFGLDLGAPAASEDFPDERPVPVQHDPVRLGAEPRGEAGGPFDVGEHERHLAGGKRPGGPAFG